MTDYYVKGAPNDKPACRITVRQLQMVFSVRPCVMREIRTFAFRPSPFAAS